MPQDRDRDGSDEPPEELKWFINLEAKEKASLLIQFVLAVIGVVALIVYIGQLSEMKRATDAATQALIIGNRPWLGIEKVIISDPPVFEEGSRGLRATISTLTVTAKNFGPSPALDTSFDGYAFYSDEGDAAAQFRRESALHCARAEDDQKRTDLTIGSAGQVVFPGLPASFRAGSNGPVRERTDFVTIIGCVVYRDQFSAKFHHTRVCMAGKWNDLSPCPWGQQAD